MSFKGPDIQECVNEVWFNAQEMDERQVECLEKIMDAAKVFANAILENTEPSPDQTVAVRKVREAAAIAMWVPRLDG